MSTTLLGADDVRGTRATDSPGYDPGHRTSPIRPPVAGESTRNALVCKSKGEGGQRCFAHAAARLDRIQATVDRLTGPAEDTPAGAHMRAKLREAHIDVATTAKGYANLEQQRAAHEQLGEDAAAAELQRLLVRAAARRRARVAGDNAATVDDGDWIASPPTGPRCERCGQFTAGPAHACPPVLVRARQVRQHAARAEPSHPTHWPAAVRAGRLAEAAFYEPVDYTDDDLAAIVAVCHDPDYGTPLDEPAFDLGQLRDTDIDPFSDPLVRQRMEEALRRGLDAAYEDEFTEDGVVMPISLYQGALEPWARPLKRAAATTIADHLAGVPNTELFDATDLHALTHPGEYEWSDTGRALIYRPRDGGGAPSAVGGATTNTAAAGSFQSYSGQDVRHRGRQIIASQTLARWALGDNGTDNSDVQELHQAADDIFMRGGGPPAETLAQTRARALLRAQYDATQQWFADRGISEIAVSRGMKWAAGQQAPTWVPDTKDATDDGQVPLNVLSSFSTRTDVASFFADRELYEDTVSVRIHGTVPVSRIVATPRTGFGCLAEAEVVVLDGPGQWTIERV